MKGQLYRRTTTVSRSTKNFIGYGADEMNHVGKEGRIVYGEHLMHEKGSWVLIGQGVSAGRCSLTF